MEARIDNLEKLISLGYRHFILFNLPNLSLTPRFQKKTHSEQSSAESCVNHFNDYLTFKLESIKESFPFFTISIYDVNQLFTKAYQHPEQCGLDEDKKQLPFVSSAEFKDTDNQARAKGFMFWDEVHPTQAVHQQLAHDMLQAVFLEHYEFCVPRDSLLTQFRERYGKRWEDDKAGRLGFFRESKINYLKADLARIMFHAIHEKGYRTLDVISDLGWINKNKVLKSSHPLIAEAMREVERLKQGKAEQNEEHFELVTIQPNVAL